MILKDELRRKLQVRFTDVAAIATFGFLLTALLPGTPWKVVFLDAAEIIALLGIRMLVKRDVVGANHLLLALVIGTVTCFDDGFGGGTMIWLVHIPIALATWILVESVTARACWLSMQALSVMMVNHTSLTPRLARQETGTFAIWQSHINLAMVTAVSLLVVRFLHKLQQAAIQEARDQKIQAESASRTKDEFLSHMSHELRTPLNSIQGFSDLSLQTQGLSPELEENLRSIRQSAEHLTHLVNDLLDLARLENGTVMLANSGFSPGICIDETLSLLRPQALEKRLELVWDESTPLPRVMGDRVRWKQILLNLVGNAVKYTLVGKVTVSARWEEEATGQGRLTVEVTDTGVGIAPEDQDKVFDRFHRLGGFAAPSGTGLGLPITAILVQAMGGRIALCSGLGKGSNFKVSLPFALAVTDPASQTSLSLVTPPNLSGYRILLAEDNRMNIRLATQVLRQLKVGFDVAEDGGQALELLRARRYDLLLLDLHMPVKNGFEVAREIRDPTSDISDKQLPILALTADAFEETRLKTQEAGMDDFLSKPFRIAELADRILRLVGEGRTHTGASRN